MWSFGGGEKPFPLLLCLLQIQHDGAWKWTWISTVIQKWPSTLQIT